MPLSTRLAATAAFIQRIGKAVFGDIQWRPPIWVSKMAGGIQQAIAWSANTVKRYPRQSLLAAGSLVVMGVAGYFGWRWYDGRPKPIEFEFTVEVPAITCYACDPPGKPKALQVSFTGSTAPLDKVGHSVDAAKSGVSITPAVAGQWYWDDDHTLRLQPTNDWPIDTKYTVKFSRKGFAADHVHLHEYGFDFKTPPFTARVTNTEFYQDPVVARSKKAVATLSFSHPVDVESLEKRVQLKMFDRVNDKIEKELAVPSHTIVFDKLKLNAYIHSGELEIPPKAGRLQITVDAGIQAARGGNKIDSALQTQVEVPGLNSLRVQDVSLDLVRDERNEPNQVLLVNMSATVKEKDLPQKLSAWLLPEKHPDPKLQAAHERYNKDKPYVWSNATVKPEVLTNANRLELKQIPGEREHYELHSFRYNANPGRQVYVTVQRGLQSFGGYLLGDNNERILSVPEFPRELSILHQGSLLAMSGEKTLSLLARNVPGIRVEAARLLPKQLQHLVTQSGGNFGQPYFNNWAFEADNIAESFTKTIKLAATAPGTAQYEAVDLGEFLHKDANDRRGVFLFRVQAWDPKTDRPLEGYEPQKWNEATGARLNDARLIVITDLGLVVKRSLDGTQDVFVQSLHTGRPVAGATVSILGVNGLPVLSETSDGEGHVRFGTLKDFQRERKPVLYLASLNGDSSFLPIERTQSLDMSRFDVGGIENTVDRSALTAYLFSDRGIYRPGEQVHLGAIVRSQDWQQKLNGVPLRLEVTDPLGTVIRRENFVPGSAGFNDIVHDTKETSPAGTYTFSLLIVRNEQYGDLIGSTTVQVRDFLPDRLRMQVAFSAESIDGWVKPDDLSAKIDLKNLFGTAAEKRRVTAQIELNPSFPSFRGFPDYKFYDPQVAKEAFAERLTDGETDTEGKAIFALNLQRFARATYRLEILAEGFEADGGRGVSAEASQLVSNMPYLVGYKPDGSLDYLSRNSAHSIDVLAIDPQAKRRAIDKLNLSRIEIRYVSVLMRQSSGTYKYESRRKEVELTSTPFSIAATGYKLNVDTTSPGNFAYVIRDADGLQLSRIEYQVAGDANLTRKLDKNAELEIKLSKKDFAPGDDIELSIRAPYAGAGLITIERERVFTWHWFKASTTNSVQHIKVPDKLEGNAYVSVTFVRDPGSDEIYTSPLSYGVQPFSVNLDARRNDIKIEAPAKVKPGETVTLRYKTERPARIVLFAVDMGILQVARYQTPEPLEFFFQKRALAVSTTQILDLLLPEFKRLSSAAPGGDGESALSKHLNPFRRKGEKPVAYWSGVLDADATTRDYKFVVPDYFNGELRVMAVAVSDERIGVEQTEVTVRGDFVLSPNAPTTVSPGDEFDVSVGVSNNVEESGSAPSIDVTLEADAGLEVVGSAKSQINIGEGHEDSVRFRLKARDQLGAQNMKFTARTAAGKGGSAMRKIDLSLRPATPYMTQLISGTVRNEKVDVAIGRDMYPQYRKLETSVSILPMAFAHGFVSYLGNYPYACTEQIVSQAIPALVLGKRAEFGYVRTQAGANIVDLLSELRSRQNDEGAYKMWPGGDMVVEFTSLYAQHALLEAQDRGERVPGDLVLQGNAYLRKIAARDGNNLNDERNNAFAIYLLTRQAQNTAAELAALRKRLDERYKKEWPQDLTAMWLAATYDLLKKDDEAARLIKGVRFTAANATRQGYDVYFTAMTQDALLLWITAKHFPERLTSVPVEVLPNMAKRINDGWYDSLSSGTTLLALDAYANAGTNIAKLSVAEVLRNKTVQALTLPQGLFPKTAFSPQAAALRMNNESDLNAFYVVDQSGFDRKPPTTAIKQGMEVLREYTDADGKPITKVTVGQEISVHLKFRSVGNKYVDNVALVDLLPGGFELVVPAQSATTTHDSAPVEEETESEGEEGEDGESENLDTESSEGYSGWHCAICVSGNYPALQYADMREDRVVFYSGVEEAVHEIVYRIKATNAGKFTTPPAYGEAMYDRSVVARSASGTLEVVRP